MISKYTGVDDSEGQQLHEGDIIRSGGIVFRIVYLNDEHGFRGFYAEENDGGRQQRVLLSVMRNIQLVARVK